MLMDGGECVGCFERRCGKREDVMGRSDREGEVLLPREGWV